MVSRKEKKVLLIVLLASAFVALASGITVYIARDKTAELAAANAVLEGRITAARNKINKLHSMRLEREEAQARLQVAESVLPSQRELETLVDNLSDFARTSGVIIAKAEPVRQTAYRAAKGTVKRFDEASFDLQLQGDFFQFVEFLNCLENYERFIKVSDFHLSAGRSEGAPLGIKLKFATFTYVDAVAAAPKPVTAVKGVTK